MTGFENLDVWKAGCRLAVDVYSELQKSRDYGLRDQMQRAAVSVMSNIAEGFERKTTADFSHFLYIAKGSLGELKSQLFLAARMKLIPPSVFGPTYSLAEEAGKVIVGLIASLAKRQSGTNTSH